MRSFTNIEMTEVPRLTPVRALEAVDGIPTLIEMHDEGGDAPGSSYGWIAAIRVIVGFTQGLTLSPWRAPSGSASV